MSLVTILRFFVHFIYSI